MNNSLEELKNRVDPAIEKRISELENGKTNVITNVTLEKISNALGKKVTDIFFIE